MSRLTLGTLLAMAVATTVAWQLGGALGTGVMGGALAGGALAGFGVAWQLHLLRTCPDKVFAATISTFLAKLAVVLLGTLFLRFFEPAARQADWRAFCVAFAAAVVFVNSLGSLDALRLLRERRAA